MSRHEIVGNSIIYNCHLFYIFDVYMTILSSTETNAMCIASILQNVSIDKLKHVVCVRKNTCIVLVQYHSHFA